MEIAQKLHCVAAICSVGVKAKTIDRQIAIHPKHYDVALRKRSSWSKQCTDRERPPQAARYQSCQWAGFRLNHQRRAVHARIWPLSEGSEGSMRRDVVWTYAQKHWFEELRPSQCLASLRESITTTLGHSWGHRRVWQDFSHCSCAQNCEGPNPEICWKAEGSRKQHGLDFSTRYGISGMVRDASRLWEAIPDVKKLMLLGSRADERPAETGAWVQWQTTAIDRGDAPAEEPAQERLKVSCNHNKWATLKFGYISQWPYTV